MSNRWIARALALAMLVLALACGAAGAESFGDTPTASVTLGRGESYKIDTSAILLGEGQKLEYKTSDKKIVSVNAEGVVTALKKGSAVVAVGYDQTLLALLKVSVTVAPKRVRLSDEMAVLSVGDTVQLTAKLTKESASALTYASGNPAVAAVDAQGKVTALSGGKTTVTVETYNGKMDSCDIYVLGGKAPTTLKLNVSDLVIQVGETFKLEPAVDEGSDALYRFASMNKKVARVSAEGVVTGARVGETVVAVRTHNGLTQMLNVTVKPRLKDVYGCLTNDAGDYLKYARALKLVRDLSAGEGAVAGRSDEVALVMTPNSCQVALNAVDNPRYCVQGVDVSMPVETAAAKLIARGWAQTGVKTEGAVEQRAFTKGGDTTHTVVIATANGTAIQGLLAVWTW